MSIKKLAIWIVTGIVLVITLIAIGIWGYWEYVEYRLGEDPFYFYEPRPYTKFIQEWDKMIQEEDSLKEDSLFTPL